MILPKKNCAYCQKEFVGRTDKRFCSANCRAMQHRTMHQNNTPSIIKETNAFLLINYHILLAIWHEQPKQNSGKLNQIIIPRIDLDKKGFRFNYITGIYINKEGKTYHYVYDFAWMLFSTQDVLIVKKK
jgi:predicted nucleic acid-binding Zn ribbon protein